MQSHASVFLPLVTRLLFSLLGQHDWQTPSCETCLMYQPYKAFTCFSCRHGASRLLLDLVSSAAVVRLRSCMPHGALHWQASGILNQLKKRRAACKLSRAGPLLCKGGLGMTITSPMHNNSAATPTTALQALSARIFALGPKTSFLQQSRESLHPSLLQLFNQTWHPSMAMSVVSRKQKSSE